VKNLINDEIKAKDIARDPVKVGKDEQYSEVFWKLEKSKDTHLVVVEDDKPIGIISIKDFTRILTDRLRRKRLAHVFASGLMTTNLISVDGDVYLKDVARKMLEKGISSMLVRIDDSYKIITKRDFLKNIDLIKEIKIKDIMTKEPITVPKGIKITGAEMLLREKKISILPVVEAGSLIGYVDVRILSKFLVELFLEPEHKHPEKLLRDLTLEEIMARPIYVTPEDSLHDIAKVLLKKGFKGTPIVTSENNPRVVGVVTETDVTKLIANV